MLKVSPPDNWQRYRKLLGEFDKRVKRAMQICVETAAEKGLELLKDRIPDSEDDNEYGDSLVIKQVELSDGSTGAAIISSVETMSKRHLRELEPQHDIVYVRVKRTANESIDEWLQMIEDLSPWTIDTIPVVPSGDQADVIYRKVSKDEVVQVRKRRKSQNKTIDEVLRKAGISKRDTIPGSEMEQPPQESKTIPDVVFNAIRMEFGLGGTRITPHWRPMIQKVKRALPREIAKNKDITDVLTNPFNREWKKPSDKQSISESDAIKFLKFQSKVT
jgi:hypothetical protein